MPRNRWVTAGGRRAVRGEAGGAQTCTVQAQEWGIRERARLGLLLLWCNGDCAVGSEWGVEWVPSTVEDRQPPTVPRRDRLEAGKRWQGPVPTPYMETRIQVCLLAPQLAVSWRLETFLTHLCDVAATRERRHQHPICSEPEPSEVRRGCCCFIDNLLGLVALSSPHRAPVDPFALRAGPPWLRGAPPGCWRWCWSPRRLSLWPCLLRSGRSWRSWNWSCRRVSCQQHVHKLAQRVARSALYALSTRVTAIRTTALLSVFCTRVWKYTSITRENNPTELLP